MILPQLIGLLALAGVPDPQPNGAPAAADDHRTEIRPGPSQPPPTALIGPERLAAEPDVTQALDGEVGLRVVRLGGLGSYATLSIRGSTPEQVLVVLDGIPLNPADGAPVDLSTLPIGPLDAIALYRGRAPYVFGSDAIGGVLALRSRSPAYADAQASVAVGSFDTRLVRGAIAMPIGERVHVGVALEYGGSASDFRFVNDQGTAWTRDDDTVERRRNAGFDQGSVLVKGLVEWRDASLTLIDLWTASRRGLPGLGVFATRASRFTLMRNLAGARFDARLGPLRLGALAYLGWADTTLDDPLGEIGLGAGVSSLTSLVPGASLELSLPLGRRGDAWRWTPSLVVAWRHEDSHGDGVAGGTRDLASVAAELSVRQRAGFELSLATRLALAPSFEPSARIELATTAIDDVRLSLSAHLSHRPPSLFELFGDTGTTLGQPDLRPERARGLELTARWDIDVDVALEAFVFATQHDDLIQIVQNAQGVVRPENVSSARIIGAEVSAEAVLAAGHLVLRGGLAWLDAIDTSDIQARTGKRLPLRPPLGATVRIEARLGGDPIEGQLAVAASPAFASARLGVWLELDHTGRDALDFANLVSVPARSLLGAGVYVALPPWRVEATLSNVLDDRVADLAGYPLPGTTALVWVKLTPD